jgi:Flp pilus assembly protein TadG
VEFALTMPLFLLWLFVTIQLGLVAVQYYSLVRVTRETVRWLAIHPDTTDSGALAHARANPLTLEPTRITAVTTSPACTALSGGRCTARLPGTTVSVTVTYDASNLVFLPTNYGYNNVRVTLPSNLPPYTATEMVE